MNALPEQFAAGERILGCNSELGSKENSNEAEPASEELTGNAFALLVRLDAEGLAEEEI